MAKSLLVIDDSTTIREAVRLALTGAEWELQTATGGEEALEALRRTRADAILCAVAPGEEDGYELCRRLGASAEGAGIPLLLMGSNVNATAALTAGASGTLPKPFTSEQLRQTLQETFEQSAFDFDELSMTGTSPAPRGGEPLTTAFNPPPIPLAEDDSELDDIEIIDLSDDDQFAELELLDDLQPVEFGPLEPGFGGAFSEALDPPAPEAPPTALPVDLGMDAPAAAPEQTAQALGEELGADTEWTVEGLLAAEEPSAAATGVVPGIPPVPEPVESGMGGDGEGRESPEQLAAVAWAETPTDIADIVLEDLLQPALPASAAASPGGGTESPFDYEPDVTAELPEFAERPTAEETGAAAVWDLGGATGIGAEEDAEGRSDSAPAPHAPSAAEATELAARIAADAGQAVRAALEQSLSAEHLAPLLAATVERVAWEVVPQLAERLIRETIAKLQQPPPTSD